MSDLRAPSAAEWSHLRRAKASPDRWAIRMTYTDDDGRRTVRHVSPIRLRGFGATATMTALCLSREEPRTFRLGHCRDITLVPAHDLLMPVPIEESE